MSGGGVCIDTPEGIAMVRLLALRSALKFEVATGMKMRGVNSLRAFRTQFPDVKVSRKAQALAHCNEVLAEFDARKEAATG